MSTLNRFVISASGSIKRAERTQQLRAKEAARCYKLQLKEGEITTGLDAIRQYEDYVTALKSVHKDATEVINWQEILKEPVPNPPVMMHDKEGRMQEIADNYRPGIFDKLFGLAKKKMAKNRQAVAEAKAKDLADFEKRQDEYKKEKADWETLQKIATGVLAKDIHAYGDCINYFQPFGEIAALGSKLDFDVKSNHATAFLYVVNDEVIPNYILSSTAKGRLSKKKMPVSKFNELYQDYVCSCILRISRETLSYLPVTYVVINAIGTGLNTVSGNLEEQTILSVVIHPETLNKLNFESIDPSDSMKNFTHNMRFSKTTGFAPVEQINADTFIN